MIARDVLRPVASAIGAVGGLVLFAASGLAGPEPLPETSHRRAEDAFVVGRIDDLEAILGTGKASVDHEPLAVRDLFWRPIDPRPEFPVSSNDRSLSSRRISWLQRLAAQRAGGPEVRSPYPAPEVGETDSYPRLSALVRDRLRRESVGARGLPNESPLAALADPDLQAFQSWYVRRAYEGPLATDLPEEDRRAEALHATRVTAIRSRNVVLGVGSLLALTLAAWSVGRILGIGRRTEAGPTERSKEEPGAGP